MLARLAENKRIDGKTIGIDATTLEANAAHDSYRARDGDEPMLTRKLRYWFGSVLRNSEDAHAVWALVWLEQLLQDIRYGIRQLVRARGWSVVAVLTLALGIGASTALFSVIDAAMLRPLPYPDPDRLVTITPETVFQDGRVSRATSSMDDMRTWQNADDVLSSVAGWGNAFGGRIADGPEPERIRVLQFTEDFLSMHGVAPVLGRDFSLEDMRAEAPAVALLGYGYWQSRYGGRTDAIGESIRLSDGVATIVGVLPRSFNTDIPVFRPLRVPLDEASRRGTGRVSVYGRLQPGITIEAASERLSSLTIPGESALEARAIVDSRLNRTTDGYRTTVNVLVAAVALILLIACVNVAGLLFARGAARQPEFATRFSVGAGWPRLMRQLLTESLVLALAGAVVGVGLASAALDAIVANLPMSMPVNSAVEINLRVLAGAAALLIPTVALFGFAPAILLSRVNLAQAFAHGARHSVSSMLSGRGGQMLIVAEVALAAILVVGAGLMIRTYARLAAFDLGFDPDGLVAMEVLPLSPDPGVHETYYPELLRRLRATVGIASAGGVDNFPLGDATTGTSVEADGESTVTTLFRVLPGYFETIDVELLDGRLPMDRDHASGFRGAVINRAAAREIFPDGRAVGGRLTTVFPREQWTVLGVVADVRHRGPLGDIRVRNQVYLPFEASEANLIRPMTIVVRPSGSGPNPLGQLRSVAQSVGPRVLVESVRTADDWFGDRVATPRRRTLLLGLLGGLGLVLTLVGVFGITAYAAARRTAEIGVRIAFGATRPQVVWMIVRDSVVPIVAGTLLGLGGAAGAARIIRSFLFQTEPTDPLTFVAVALMLAGAGSLAALIPAFRAARVDPTRTLRAS